MAIKKKIVMQEELPVVYLINQIIDEGKELTTKTYIKVAKEKLMHEEWIKKIMKHVLLQQKNEKKKLN